MPAPPDAPWAVGARRVPRGGMEALEEGDLLRLVKALGLTGLEVRSGCDGRPMWRCGAGRPGSAEVLDRLSVVPLGGAPAWLPGWRLLLALFGLFMPDPVAAPESYDDGTGVVGNSRAMRDLRRELREFAPTDITVLLKGETGAGKEVAARALHRLSGRTGSFVPVNIAAMPGNLLESELFGSLRGAFTGADRSRRGLVDQADRGTLFLDEVGDVDPRVQVHLLRFLETKEVRPLGSDRVHRVDVRIVVATHVDLRRLIADGRFRKDLYYRLAAVQIAVPPLRERREDILILKSLFQAGIEARNGVRPCHWSQEAESVLVAHPWPGNVRELRHAVEVATVRAAGCVVAPSHLPIQPRAPMREQRWHSALAECRRRMLSAALRRNGGNRSAAARDLGISRQSLLYHIRKLDLGDDLH
jgi:sigma-54-dependent transcriptional regulator